MKYITKLTKAAKKQMRKIRRTFKKELTKRYGKKIADQININARHIVCGEAKFEFTNQIIDGKSIQRLKAAQFTGSHYDPENIYRNRLYKAGLVTSDTLHPHGEQVLGVRQPTVKNPNKIIQKSFFSNEWAPEDIAKASVHNIHTNNALLKSENDLNKLLESVHKNIPLQQSFKKKQVKTIFPNLKS